MRKSYLAGVVAMVLLVAPGARAAETISPSESFRAEVIARAAQAGVDADWLLGQSITLSVARADGTTGEHTARIEDLIADVPDARIAGGAPVELDAGNVEHLYLNSCFPCATALAYRVTKSSVVPDAPPVFLPPPATPYLFVVGGPLRQVKGSGYSFGMHAVGSTFGSNVDTDGGGQAPVWLPVVSAGAVIDKNIDLIGHAEVAQGQFCVFGLCVATGVLFADGVTLFDNTTPVSLPIVP